MRKQAALEKLLQAVPTVIKEANLRTVDGGLPGNKDDRTLGPKTRGAMSAAYLGLGGYGSRDADTLQRNIVRGGGSFNNKEDLAAAVNDPVQYLNPSYIKLIQKVVGENAVIGALLQAL
jgi:hypothetical protein